MLVSDNGQAIPEVNIPAAFVKHPQQPSHRVSNHIAAFHLWPTACDILNRMDIARPEFKRQKRKRQIFWGAIGLVLLVGATVGVSRLKPAAPEVDRSTVWTDTVKRG